MVVLGIRLLAYSGIELLLELGYRVPLIFTTQHDIADEPTVDHFRALASRAGAELHVTARVNRAEYVTRFQALGVDLILTLGWRHIIGPSLLRTSRLGGVNVHMAPLPRFRGFAPNNWALLVGETTAGVTLHHMAEEYDMGDIIDQVTFPIGPRDTIADLDQQGLAAALSMMRKRLPEIAAGTAPRRPQDEGDALYCFPRQPSDGEIDWSRSAVEIDRLIRAVTHPYPGAFTYEGLDRLFVWRARPAEDGRRILAVPGSVVRTERNGSVWVATGDGVLQLESVQADGGREMPAGDHLRSVRVRLGLNASEALRAMRS